MEAAETQALPHLLLQLLRILLLPGCAVPVVAITAQPAVEHGHSRHAACFTALHQERRHTCVKLQSAAAPFPAGLEQISLSKICSRHAACLTALQQKRQHTFGRL